MLLPKDKTSGTRWNEVAQGFVSMEPLKYSSSNRGVPSILFLASYRCMHACSVGRACKAVPYLSQSACAAMSASGECCNHVSNSARRTSYPFLGQAETAAAESKHVRIETTRSNVVEKRKILCNIGNKVMHRLIVFRSPRLGDECMEVREHKDLRSDFTHDGHDLRIHFHCTTNPSR